MGGVSLQLPAQEQVRLLQEVEVGGRARLLDTARKVHLQHNLLSQWHVHVNTGPFPEKS